MKKLMCPCGGEIEQRGNVRFYCQGSARSYTDGKRLFVEETWKAPVETLELDDPPYYCLSCDRQLGLDELVPTQTGVPSRPEHCASD